MVELVKQEELGDGWSAALYDDGTMVVWGGGERIELGAASVALLRQCLAQAEDAADARRVSRDRNFIVGKNQEGEWVYAQRQRPGSRSVIWRTQMPAAELDLMDGSLSDENRAIYHEVSQNCPHWVHSVKSVNWNGVGTFRPD